MNRAPHTGTRRIGDMGGGEVFTVLFVLRSTYEHLSIEIKAADSRAAVALALDGRRGESILVGVWRGRVEWIGTTENMPRTPTGPDAAWRRGTAAPQPFTVVGFNFAARIKSRVDVVDAVHWAQAASEAIEHYGGPYIFVAAATGIHPPEVRWDDLSDEIAAELDDEVLRYAG